MNAEDANILNDDINWQSKEAFFLLGSGSCTIGEKEIPLSGCSRYRVILRSSWGNFVLWNGSAWSTSPVTAGGGRRTDVTGNRCRHTSFCQHV